MNKSIDEARKLMSAQKASDGSDNKMLSIKTHAAIRARWQRAASRGVRAAPPN